MRLTKEALGWPTEPAFWIPEDVLAHFRQALDTGRDRQAAWLKRLETYAADYPEQADRKSVV